MTFPLLLEIVARQSGVDVVTICGRSRSASIVDARAVAVWLCREHIPEFSLREIGNVLGRDHTSVGYLYNSFRHRLESRRCRALIRRCQSVIELIELAEAGRAA